MAKTINFFKNIAEFVSTFDFRNDFSYLHFLGHKFINYVVSLIIFYHFERFTFESKLLQGFKSPIL